MADGEAKPLQAMFDVGDEDYEVTEGIGFEQGVKYRFSLEKPPQGKYMQYGGSKVIDGKNYSNLYVLSKKCPADLADQYQRHPDQFEIFTPGEINGMQALVPGADFEKFKPFLTQTINIAWVHTTDAGTKRLVFMQMSPKPVVNPKHPEWESAIVRIARKLGVDVPESKDKGRFNISFLHPGVTIEAEVDMIQRKGDTKERPNINIESITVPTTSAEPQQKIEQANDIDPEIRAVISELAEGEKSIVKLLKKIKEHLKSEGEVDPAVAGKYAEAATKMKDRKEILV